MCADNTMQAAKQQMWAAEKMGVMQRDGDHPSRVNEDAGALSDEETENRKHPNPAHYSL